MRYIIYGVKKFSFKDKITGLNKPSCIVYACAENSETAEAMFFDEAKYNELGFDSYVLDKTEVASLFADYKTCQIDFDQKGYFTKLSA